MPGAKLVAMMQDAAQISPTKSADLVFGVVKKIEPIEIKVDGRFTIGEKFIILSVLCRKQTITVPALDEPKHLHIVPEHLTLPAGEDDHIHKIEEQETEKELQTITLWRGLKVGDKVRMLRVAEGKLYYVIEREDDLE